MMNVMMWLVVRHLSKCGCETLLFLWGDNC